MAEQMVTILSPCYNVETFLPQCLDSILRQTYNNLQIVLIDDGSMDNTWSVMQEYATKDKRIEIYHQENQGVSATRNNLLEKVRGEWMLFIDSDDWIEPDSIEYLVNIAQYYNSDFVKCNMVTNDTPVNKGPYKVVVWNQEKAILCFLMHTIFRGSLCDKLIKTTLYKDIRFDNKISYGEDALVIWRALQNASNVVVSNRQFYHYRMNDTSISHQKFDNKKITGHLAWSTITEGCSKWWPQYLHIAQARWGMEDMYLLRQAGQNCFKKNNAICELQRTVRKFIPQMKSTGMLVGKEILNANIMCRWYGYGFLYSFLNKLKRKFICY